ncbi:sulfotransferase family protein [Streptomyces spiroverticillatus]|nr:sulfotransferase family protein [Streptomyces spiroverticillatus]
MTQRLVPSPVFLLSAVRSGSTLLRCVLDSHSQVHAPHEMHLTQFAVQGGQPQTTAVLEALGLNGDDLEHLLWDRLLHERLSTSGKRTIVEKTPTNLLAWQRLHACWPEARYVFLLRHPEHILRSMLAAHHGLMGEQLRLVHGEQYRDWAAPEAVLQFVTALLHALVEARAALPGLTVRYEDLVADPEPVVKEICAFLDIPWEADMLHYGRSDHGPFKVFLGDVGDRIATGTILPPQDIDLPVDPRPLRALCTALGYTPSPWNPQACGTATQPPQSLELR